MNWNLIFSIVGFHLISYGDFSKVTCAAVQELYRSNLVCTLIPILKGVFWSKQYSCTVLGSMCTVNYFNGDPVLAVENSSKWPVRPYTNCTGQIWYDHWFPSWKVCFGPNSIAVQSWEVCALEIEFFQWRSCVSYREFFKVTCAAVHELYRSNLVWPLIPILKGVFWSKQHSCTVLGSMCTENWIFSKEGLY